MTDRARTAMNDIGSLNAIFADSGLSGNSQERIKAVTEGDAQRDLTTLDRNSANRTSQNTAEAGAVAARTHLQVNAVPPPSLLGSGLQIATYAAEDYQRRHPNAGP